MTSEITIPMTTRLPMSLHLAAKMAAEAETRSLNNLIEHALKEYLRQRSHLLPAEVSATLQPDWHQ